MNTKKQHKAAFKKTFFIFIASFVILLISIPLVLFLLFKSPYFLNIVERIINSRIEKHVEIVSIFFADGHGIVIKDVTARHLFLQSMAL